MRLLRVCGAVALIAAVTGCATEPGPAAARGEIIGRELAALIADGAPEVAVMRVDALERDEPYLGIDYRALRDAAIARMEDEFGRAVDEGRPADALRIRANLATLGREPFEPGEPTLRVEIARGLLEEGNPAAALSVLLGSPELSSLPPEVLEEALTYAKALNNRPAVSTLLELLGPAARERLADYVEFAAATPSPLEMTDGVVTVWVNRGLRIESGVGIPDRVIGSGFFVDPRGYLLTNYHVVASEVDPDYRGYSRLYVRLPDSPLDRVPARVVGFSRVFDVALVKVEIDAPYVFGVSNAGALEPGRRIIAIGSPGGLENSVTSGIVSATGRRFLQMGDAMQMDVPVNPGNSGGPLLDEQGRLVGVVFAGIRQFEGVNFAIPLQWINRFFPDLYTEGPVAHPWMGVAVEPSPSGLEVAYVAKASPAEQAGISVGDVIRSVNGWPASRVGAAQSVLLDAGTGALIPVEWTRGDLEMSGLLAVAKRPDNPVGVALEADLQERLFPVLFGMQVERSGAFSIGRSYEVTRVFRGSLADEIGISAGDVFTEREFRYDRQLRAVFLRIFIRKRTEGFLQTSLQLPALVERDNFL